MIIIETLPRQGKPYTVCEGPSWSWSYGSWIHNYLCNQCLSPLKFESRSCEVYSIHFMITFVS